MSEDKLDDKGLKQAGLKITLPRLKILKILEEAKPRHISAEEIFRKLMNQGDDVGLATIYRVLTQFEAADLVRRHHFDNDHALFEINEGEHHDHMMCIKCGSVTEFFDELIEARQEQIAQQHQFKITNHSHYLYGYCSYCQQSI